MKVLRKTTGVFESVKINKGEVNIRNGCLKSGPVYLLLKVVGIN